MKRKPWLSALLNFLLAGLGQLYCGHMTKAIVIFIINLIVMNISFAFLVFLEIHPLNSILFAFVTLSMWIFLILNGYKAAGKVSSDYSLQPFNKWYLYTILIIALSFTEEFVIPVFGNYKFYAIPSQNMENTLLVGDYILADLNAYKIENPEPGDIVIFLFPGDLQTKYIKRCVAIQGDTVLLKDKKLFVNGLRFPDEESAKYIDTTADGLQKIMPRREGGKDSRDNFGPYLVPSASYFMMGDSRDNSYDSRYWGAVHQDLILGKLIRIHFSTYFDRIGIRPR